MNMIKPKILGFSMVEVLVTIVILMIGLLGLAGLQGRALTAQMESYQRGQALFLLKDMADRINANRKNAGLYLNQTMGTGAICPAPIDTTLQGRANGDLCEWHNALLGSAERQDATSVGAMIGARGCVYQSVPTPGGPGEPPAEYVVVVSWQGINNTKAPDVTAPDSPGQCGFNQYTDRDGAVKETLHRVVSLPITMATLK